MPRRPNWRAVKIHRNYTVEEAALKLGVAKGTVLRWVKGGALPAITDRRPFLVLGHDLASFGRRGRRPKQRCALAECYCFNCRAPRAPAGGMADLMLLTPKVGDLEALCSTCGGVMHKRVSLAKTERFAALLDLTIRAGSARITKCHQPRLNDDK